MLDKTQVTKIAVAGFGAAMASVYAIPEAHATILPISFNPSKASFTPYSVRTQWVSSGMASLRLALSFVTLCWSMQVAWGLLMFTTIPTARRYSFPAGGLGACQAAKCCHPARSVTETSC